MQQMPQTPPPNQIQKIYAQLNIKIPKPDTIIAEGDEDYPCFEVSEIPDLALLVHQHDSSIKYVNIEYLFSDNETVYNMMFFDDNNEHVSGAELTRSRIYWDDEN